MTKEEKRFLDLVKYLSNGLLATGQRVVLGPGSGLIDFCKTLQYRKPWKIAWCEKGKIRFFRTVASAKKALPEYVAEALSE